MAGEFDFIRWVRQSTVAHRSVHTGIGDDLAVLHWAGEDLLLVGIDQVLDGVHFDSKTHLPQQIGRKVVNRNLSDCAAMAALPVALLVSLALPRRCDLHYVKALHQGMTDTATPFDCAIVGGDTGVWDGALAVTVAVLARSAGVTPVTRRGAAPGQFVHVSGPLGGSILGRHLSFNPRIDLARTLAGSGQVSAMIDLSDGLSRDAAHLTQAGHVAIVVDAAKVPIHADAVELSRQSGKSPLDHALHDGEDHELLLCSPSPTLPGTTCIGVVEPGEGVWLIRDQARSSLTPAGWEHQLG